jgi:hypothetical protein
VFLCCCFFFFFSGGGFLFKNFLRKWYVRYHTISFQLTGIGLRIELGTHLEPKPTNFEFGNLFEIQLSLVLFNLNQTGFINFQKISPCHFTSCEASHLYIHMSFYFCGSCVWVSIIGIHTQKFRLISFAWLLFSSLFHLKLFSMKHFEFWSPKAILRCTTQFVWFLKCFFQLSRCSLEMRFSLKK